MSAKSVIGSIIASVIIMCGLIYFGLPYIFPRLRMGDSVMTEGIVLQSMYREWDTQVEIYDNEILGFKKIPNTELEITIQNNSQITAEFSTTGLMYLNSSFFGGTAYVIMISVDSISNCSLLISHFDQNPTTGYHWLTYNLHIDLVTPFLTAGTYNVTMYWRSTYNAPGDNYLQIPGTDYNRSLWVQELKES